MKMNMRFLIVAVMLTLTLSCGGGATMAPTGNVSGAYEFVVTSTVTGGVTLVEANLTASGNQSGANGPTQAQILTLENKTWYINGVCPGSTPGQNGVSAAITGNKVAFAFNEGGNVTSGQGILTGSTVAGNYAITGSACADLQGVVGFPQGSDLGGFVGNQVPNLSGTYTGTLNLPSGVDNAALALVENPDRTLTVKAVLTGLDNGTFALTGSAVGNSMFVSGSVNGRALSLLGYFDKTGAFTRRPNSLLVFDYQNQVNAGLLLGQ